MISLERWPQLKRLRERLNGKAKTEPRFRFYRLYDKVYRSDVLEAAYAQCRSNGGAPGVDGRTFEDIEAYGVGRFLAELTDELKTRRYKPEAVRRVLIPKAGQPGQFRPLGIPTIKDRVVQQSVKLLLDPVFEVDFTDNAYAYREGQSALNAVSDVHTHLKAGYTEVVDADLSKYFDTIPHDQLMRSVERRIADTKVLWLIRHWLKAPVQETNEAGQVVLRGGRKSKAGTPQGGVISPLLANIYFRRFLLAWEQFGYGWKFRSRIVNYADDFVILCRERAVEALQAARNLIAQLGLTLNEKKTRVCRAGETPFNFLGYTFETLYQYGGQPYLGLRPSDQSAHKYREAVRQVTAARQTTKPVEEVVAAVNRVVRGYWNYYCLGTSAKLRWELNQYTRYRVWRWTQRKHAKPRQRSSGARGVAADLKARIKAVKQGLVNGMNIPRKPLAKGNAACFVQ